MPNSMIIMKIRFAVLLLPLALNAQVTPTSVDTVAAVVAPYQVVAAGPHERTWQSVSLDAAGRTNVHSFVELATGLNYFNDATGKWEESQPRFEVTKDGHAIARKGQHQVNLAGDINSGGSVSLLMPDGQQLLSNPMGLSFKDLASGKNVLLGEVTNCIGELVASNVVLYPNAFDTLKAAIRYTYTRDGFEQDVILYENPGSPADYGLDPATTVLEMYSEFHNPPAPQSSREATTDNVTEDQTLDFGKMQIGHGKAYFLKDDTFKSADVVKTWASIDDRIFLIESVPYQDVQPMLQKMELGKGQVASRSAKDRKGLVASLRSREQTMKVASITPGRMKPSSGVVLDYSTLNTSQTNYTFKCDTTYFISGNISLFGSNTVFEGGTVLKYTNNVTLTVSTPITWQGSAYRPVVLTARDDATVGESITPSNPLSGYYAATALNLDANTANTNYVLRNLRIANAQNAIAINGKSSHAISHAQLVTCQNGIGATNAEFSLRNALFQNVLTNFTGSSSTGRVEQMTVDNATWLNKDIGTNLFLTNCLLVAVTNIGSYSGNTVSNVSSGSGVFQQVGAGAHYLAANSVYRNAGTTNINALLAGDLKKMTTYPPILYSNMTISVDMVLGPQAQRDTDTPDIGYHYDPIDYAVNSLGVTNATLSLTNGVALATFGYTGIWLQDGSQLFSEGGPLNHNHLTRFFNVQEQGTNWGGGILGQTATINSYNYNIAPANAQIRFTDFDGLSNCGHHLYTLNTNWTFNSLFLQDCTFNSGNVTLDGPTNSTFTLNNNLFERVTVWIQRATQISFYNNLYRYGSIISFNAGTNNCVIKDNAFDSSSLTDFGNALTASYNAYINMGASRFFPTNANDKVLTSFNYTNGPLGNYYQVSTNLYDAGSRSASEAGLYHYTVRADQAKETNSTVDIGYHYVAALTSDIGLVGYWKLDETGGTIASDSSGYGFNGTLLNGPVWTSGPVGGALSFDGLNDSVNVPDTQTLRLGTTMTIAFWVRKDANPTYYSMLVGKGSGNYRNYKVWLYTAGTILFQFQRTDGVGLNLHSTTALQPGSWYHVACTYNGSTAAIYINGVLNASTSFSGTPITSNDPLTFGYSGWNEFFKGALDDVRIYNRTLRADEIASLASKTYDSDGDGIPDYLEDRNGDGVYDTGDFANFNSSDTDGDGVNDYLEYVQGRNPRAAGTVPDTNNLIQLRVYTPLK